MRCLFWGLGWLAACGLAFAGCMVGFFGFVELNVERNVYQLDVGPRGEDCGGGFVHLDVETGEELYCGPPGVIRTQKPKTNAMYGFTDKQKEDVYSLARELGEDGLDEADEDELQQLLDEYKATVPPERRYRTAGRIRGVPYLWIGAGMLVVGAAGILVLRRVAA
ncbi:hypothetical protein [Kribbella sp. CA-247076]|uniref:hypothetical protein n=1 Tax=Kribbella sp. CA-247076 TaxID=3239941 RepID=UPI003D8D7C26